MPFSGRSAIFVIMYFRFNQLLGRIILNQAQEEKKKLFLAFFYTPMFRQKKVRFMTSVKSDFIYLAMPCHVWRRQCWVDLQHTCTVYTTTMISSLESGTECLITSQKLLSILGIRSALSITVPRQKSKSIIFLRLCGYSMAPSEGVRK